MLSAVAARAAALVGARRHEADRDGTGISVVPLDQRNIIVVVSRDAQRTFVSARLDAIALRDVVVDTADRLQGGQWAAIVALDPSPGPPRDEHAMSLGRLCMMVSRHTTHLTWCTTTGGGPCSPTSASTIPTGPGPCWAARCYAPVQRPERPPD